MENRDTIISTGLEAIENKIKNLRKPEENYKFKTNCKFNDKNIKTLNRKELTELIVKLFVWKDTAEAIYKAHPERFTSDDMKTIITDIHGFSFSDWESDMFYLLDKIKYNEAKKDLEAKANALRNFYSEDKKTDIAINEILASL